MYVIGSVHFWWLKFIAATQAEGAQPQAEMILRWNAGRSLNQGGEGGGGSRVAHMKQFVYKAREGRRMQGDVGCCGGCAALASGARASFKG